MILILALIIQSTFLLSAAELVIDVRPEILFPGATLKPNSQFLELDIIKSLTLSRYNETNKEFEDLLLLDASTMTVKHLVELEHAQISYGDLFLNLAIQNPTQFDANVYRCHVAGENAYRKNIFITAKKSVEVDKSQPIYDDEKASNSSQTELVISQKRASPRLNFTGNSLIIKELFQPLTLSCSLQTSNNDSIDDVQVNVLYILHETKRIIASISKDQPLALSLYPGSTKVQGKIESKDSYLQVTWKNPKISETGKYFCLAHARNSTGQDIVFDAAVTIHIIKLTTDDLAAALGRLQEHMDEGDEKQKENWQNTKTIKETLAAQTANLANVENFLKQHIEAEEFVQTTTTSATLPKSCRGVFNTEDRVVVTLSSGLKVMCDTKTDGGGWIIFQRRINGNVDFFRGWKEYRDGFGDYKIGEFYLGNENIYKFTSTGKYDLRIDMEFNKTNYFVRYSRFQLSSEETNYKLEIDGYSGNANDYFNYHNNSAFTTFDRDNDNSTTANCALSFKAAWWYRSCYRINLNGLWGYQDLRGLVWSGVSGNASLTMTEMKIRETELD